MPDAVKSVFQRKKADLSKLTAYGFERLGGAYIYRTTLARSGFLMSVVIDSEGAVSAALTDPATGEPYTLHLAPSATGGFVGDIRQGYEQVLGEIAAKCFEPDVFKSAHAKALIEYVRKAYAAEPEYLWQRFPDNAVWRRGDTGKWFGALLSVAKSKLGIQADGVAEIIDLRIKPSDLSALIDSKRYFPGYHMNKNNWYTMLLDESVGYDELCERIDISYSLAVK